RFTPLRLEPVHVEGADRTVEALEAEFAHRLGGSDVLSGGLYLAIDEDLTVLRLAAQARGDDDDGADSGIVVPALEADAAEGGVAVGNADAKAEVVADPAPLRGKLGKAGAASRLPSARRAHTDRGMAEDR